MTDRLGWRRRPQGFCRGTSSARWPTGKLRQPHWHWAAGRLVRTAAQDEMDLPLGACEHGSLYILWTEEQRYDRYIGGLAGWIRLHLMARCDSDHILQHGRGYWLR